MLPPFDRTTVKYGAIERKVAKINVIFLLTAFGNYFESKRKVATYAQVSTGSMEQEKQSGSTSRFFSEIYTGEMFPPPAQYGFIYFDQI